MLFHDIRVKKVSINVLYNTKIAIFALEIKSESHYDGLDFKHV